MLRLTNCSAQEFFRRLIVFGPAPFALNHLDPHLHAVMCTDAESPAAALHYFAVWNIDDRGFEISLIKIKKRDVL